MLFISTPELSKLIAYDLVGVVPPAGLKWFQTWMPDTQESTARTLAPTSRLITLGRRFGESAL